MSIAIVFQKVFTALVAVIGFGLVVFIHECGHFLFCKLFGVKTPTFSIGMGPALFSFKIGSTNFQVSALPVGGYVEIEYDEDNRKTPGNFHALSYAKKILILLGGVSFNLLGALAVYTSVNYFVGTSNKIASITVASVEQGALVSDVLQPGDIILGINNNLFTDLEMTYGKYLTKIFESKGRQLSLLVNRDTQDQDWIIIDVPNSNKTQGILGAMLQPTMGKPIREQSLWISLKKAFEIMIQQMGFVIKGTYSLIKSKSVNGVAGPIMTITQGFKIADNNFIEFLLFLGFISLNLALFNVLPLSLFDGGRVFIVTAEALVGNPLTALTNILHLFSFVFIGGLFVFISFKEIKTIILGLIR